MKKQIMNILMRQMVPSAGTIIVVALMLFGYRAWAMPAAAPASSDDTSGVISYQGYVTDDTGEPLNGEVSLGFSLYDVDTGGSYLWSENYSSTEPPRVPVSNGVFNVLLGSKTPIPASVLSKTGLFLEVAVNGERMEPREPVGMVPIALHAVRASGLSAADGTPGDAVTVDEDGNVTVGQALLVGQGEPEGYQGVTADYNDLIVNGQLAAGGAHVSAIHNLGVGYGPPGASAGEGSLNVKGKVGIGTESPQTALDVVGDVNVEGDIVLEDGALRIPEGNTLINFYVHTLSGGASVPVNLTYPKWLCGVVGFRSYGGDIDEWNQPEAWMVNAYTYLDGHDWMVTADMRSQDGKNESWRVWVMCASEKIADAAEGIFCPPQIESGLSSRR